MRRLTLWQSMSLAYGSLATLIIIVIGAAYYFTTSIVVQRTLQRIISSTAKELIENHLIYQEGEIRYKRAETGLTIAGFLRGTGVSAMIFDERLNRIGTYGLFRNLAEQQELTPAIDGLALEQALLSGESEYTRTRYGDWQSPYEVMYVPIALDHKVVGVLQMAITASQLEQLQFLSGYLILTILPIALLIMWLVAFYLGKTWLKPFYRLIRLLQATQTHRLIDLPKLPASSYPEIDALQTTIKNLLTRIRTNIEAQQRFTAHAAHELKTPLAQAVSELDVALPLATSPELTEHISTVKYDLLSLNRKLESLMALSLIDNKTAAFNPKPVHLNQIINEVIRALQPMAKKQGVAIISEVEDRHYWFMVPDHATLLFANLISNAIKFNKRKGKVVVKSYRDRTKQWVSISDTGVGIMKKEQPLLFRRFFRSETTAPIVPGYGIGLTLVYSIASRSNILIRIESEPGKGTTVKLNQKLSLLPHELAS
jgi:signal transduction histidine kinase